MGLKLKPAYLEPGIVQQAMRRNGYFSDRDLALALKDPVVTATARNFRIGTNIHTETFKEFCQLLCWDWQEVFDQGVLPPQPQLQPQPQPLPPPDEPPTGVIPLDLSVYVARSPQEENWYGTISQTSALIRICAPRRFGKSSLARRLLDRGQKQGHRPVYLSLQTLTADDVVDTKTFFGWFYSAVAMELGLSQYIKHYAEMMDFGFIGSTTACLNCFANYLLPALESTSLTLCIDKLDHILINPIMARDFFAMLRVMNEKTKTDSVWQQFRLVLVHASEEIESRVPLNINQSPFNVGRLIKLSEFTPDQVKTLANIYELDWQMAEIEALMSLVGGLPFWIHVSLFYLSRKQVTLPELLEKNVDCSIYDRYWDDFKISLQLNPELTTAIAQVANSPEPISLEPNLHYQLYSLGLIKMVDNLVVPRCQLFRLYFQN